jgi:type VI secretion system protein ImpK
MLDLIQAPVPSVALFQEFTRDLIALKWTVTNSPAGESESTAPDNSPASELATQSRPTLVWNRVVSLLNQQALQASHLGGPASLEFHREAIYVMAALADETFLQLEWEGRDYWLNHLVEMHVFRTHAAGEIFFRRLDGLLTREDDAAAEIAAVYLFAIGLGFRGKYRGDGYSVGLEAYRMKLHIFIARRKSTLAADAKTLFPEAYRNTIQNGLERPIPSARNWRIALVCAFAGWLIVSQYLWMNLTQDLNARLAKIDAAAGSTSITSASQAKKH